MNKPKFSSKEEKRRVLRSRAKERRAAKDAVGNFRADNNARVDKNNPNPVRSVSQGGLPQ
jgi:hypothetical protein